MRLVLIRAEKAGYQGGTGRVNLVGSGPRTQPGQRDGNEPADRGLGGKSPGCCERVDAVRRELVRANVIPEVARGNALYQEVANHAVEVPLGPWNLLVPMQKDVYKPRGITPYGRRKENERRTRTRRREAVTSS
jgi:hypothetical protein